MPRESMDEMRRKTKVNAGLRVQIQRDVKGYVVFL